jgi:hypothetical protein
MRDPAPLFTDTYDLTAWLLAGLHEHPSSLARALCQLSLDLLDAVTEALAERDALTALDEADALLARLRLRLRLAGSIELLDERRMLHALERADGIGRQIGALMRHRAR